MTVDDFRQSLTAAEPPANFRSPSPDCSGMAKAIGREPTSLPSRTKASKVHGCTPSQNDPWHPHASSSMGQKITGTGHPSIFGDDGQEVSVGDANQALVDLHGIMKDIINVPLKDGVAGSLRTPTLRAAPSALENLLNSDEFKAYLERLASGKTSPAAVARPTTAPAQAPPGHTGVHDTSGQLAHPCQGTFGAGEPDELRRVQGLH